MPKSSSRTKALMPIPEINNRLQRTIVRALKDNAAPLDIMRVLLALGANMLVDLAGREGAVRELAALQSATARGTVNVATLESIKPQGSA